MVKINSSSLWDRLLVHSNYRECSPTTRERIKLIASLLRDCNNVLNIGSGQGYLESRIKEQIEADKYHWNSLDITEIGLANIRRISKKINTFKANILKLPFQLNTFDCVVASEVLEHLDKNIITVAYAQIYKVLKTSGRLIISVPVYEQMPLKNHPVGHYRKYTPNIISRELQKNKFKIIKVHYLYAFNTSFMFRSLINRVIKLRRPNVLVLVCEKL